MTLREKGMLEFVDVIIDKPRWCEKVHNEDIVARWRNEYGSEEQQRYEPACLDQKCFDNVRGPILAAAFDHSWA